MSKESTAVSLTAYLMNELVNRKTEVVFCDEKRLPFAAVHPFYGSHDTSLKFRKQIEWKKETKDLVWAEIVRAKINGQAAVLTHGGYPRARMLTGYISEIVPCDITNREGHAASIISSTHFEISYSQLENIDPVIKLLNFYFATDDLDFTERLTEYMRISSQLFRKKLFILFNLKSYISKKEIEKIYELLFYEKIQLLLIESHQTYCCDCEKTKIIDIDLCEI